MSYEKKNCFGYSEKDKKCKVLKKTYCKNEYCKFFKTNEELQEGIKKYGYVKPY